MEKSVVVIVLLVLGSAVFAQMSVINDVIKNAGNNEICLLDIEDGKGEVLATTIVGEEGKFNFMLTSPYEEFNFHAFFPEFTEAEKKLRLSGRQSGQKVQQYCIAKIVNYDISCHGI